MLNFSYSALVFSALVGWSLAFADSHSPHGRSPSSEVVEGGKSSEVNSGQVQAPPCDCKCEYDKNKCDEFKNSLPKADQAKILSCGSDQKAGSDDQLKGCLHGVYDSTVLPLLNLKENIGKVGAAVGKIIEDDKKCNADPVAKALLLRNVAQAYEPEMIRIMVGKWTCGQIATEARNRENAFYKSIGDKKVAFMNKLEETGISLKSEQFDAQFHAQLSDKELQFLSNKGPQEDPAQALKRKFGNIWNCYTHYERVRLVCDDATTAVTSLAATYGLSQAAFKTVRAADGLAESAAMAKSSAAFKAGAANTAFDEYVLAKNSNLPENLISKLGRIKSGWRYTGGELTYRSPFPGAESMTMYWPVGVSGAKPTMSVFLGWGSSTPQRVALMKAAREAGFDFDTAPRLLPSAGFVTEEGTGFVRTSDPEKMMKFLRQVMPNL